MNLLKILSVFVIYIFGTFTVYGIKCYQCNSIDNSACTHLEDKGEIIFPTLCNVTEGFMGYADANETDLKPFCRKTYLSYMNFERQKFTRVIRSCGLTPDKNKNCYVATNDDHEETVCQCYEDGCNGSTIKYPSITFIIILMSPLIYCYYMI